MLRGALIAVILVAVQAGSATGARSAPHRITTNLTATGEITKLGPSRIAVPGLRCAIPTKLTASSGRFVIGDPVKIACLDGALRSIKYSPERATAQTTAPGGGNAPATPTIPPPGRVFDPSTASHIVYTVGTLFPGGGPTGETASVTAPISDLEDSTLTAGGLTCSFSTSFGTLIQQVARLGDNVTLTCTGGTLVRMASVGTVTHSS